MNKFFIFLVILICVPPLSFAQLADHDFKTSIEENHIYIIVQIEIRDSNQNLVGYIETDRITVENLEELSGMAVGSVAGGSKKKKHGNNKPE